MPRFPLRRAALTAGALAAAVYAAHLLEAQARAAGLDAGVRGLAVLPPLAGIVLAFATRRLLPSLALAVALGAGIAADFDPSRAATRLFVDYAGTSVLGDVSHLWIVVFTVALIGTVTVASEAGAIRAIVTRLAGVARGPRSAQLVAFVAGLVAFFDDYTNAILVGTAMRPLFDRLRISREKLAFIVDSTSAPVAGLAVISTWIGYEVGLFEDAARALGLGASGYEIFFRALPFRFYCLFALIFVFFNVTSGREFGPMRAAELRARAQGGPRAEDEAAGEEAVPARAAWVAILPIGLVLFGTLFGLLWDGGAFFGKGSLLSVATWREVLGAADSTRVLDIASLAGLLAVFALALGLGRLSLGRAVRAFLHGARTAAPAVGILLLAWGLHAVCQDLRTSELLVAVLSDAIAPALLPVATFLLAAATAFATGTSWGTMGILLPTVLPLAHHLGGVEIFVLCAAAVLDGAIFGDHVSPLSDTTVLSSAASGVEPMEHVRTQMPYALVAYGVALIFGHGAAAVGMPALLSWPLGLLALGAAVRLLGARIEPAPTFVPAPSEPATS